MAATKKTQAKKKKLARKILEYTGMSANTKKKLEAERDRYMKELKKSERDRMDLATELKI